MAYKEKSDVERALGAFGAATMPYQSFGPDSAHAAGVDLGGEAGESHAEGAAFPLLAAAFSPAPMPPSSLATKESSGQQADPDKASSDSRKAENQATSVREPAQSASGSYTHIFNSPQPGAERNLVFGWRGSSLSEGNGLSSLDVPESSSVAPIAAGVGPSAAPGPEAFTSDGPFKPSQRPVMAENTASATTPTDLTSVFRILSHERPIVAKSESSHALQDVLRRL